MIPNCSSTGTATFEQVTVKRNQKMELNKSELLKLLAHLEGELQARDIVIATLKSEKIKRMLTPGRSWLNSSSDPRAALQRDAFAGTNPPYDEDHMQSLAERQTAALDNYVVQHKKMVAKMTRQMKEMEERHLKVVQELEDEKRKHEHDTAQGDDITYGLEKERTRLQQELEMEKTGRKKAEKDLKKLTENLEKQKDRTRTIVILLIAEKRKAHVRYLEERKRSEDLAQILAEEKSRYDSMAEGLEEESKKSLQMEAELERQQAAFDTERQQLKAAIAKEEKRFKELEVEAERHRGEADSLKKQLVEAHHVAMFQAGSTPGLCPRPPHPPAKPASSPRPVAPQSGIPKVVWGNTGDGSVSPPPNAMLSSVAKVVQPTATVSSVPVCGPTTGIARSVSPGQTVRGGAGVFPQPFPVQQQRDQQWPGDQPSNSPVVAQIGAVKPNNGATIASGASTVIRSPANPAKVLAMPADAAKFSFQSTVKKTGARGFPPPVPPNKPVVPPKKDVVRRTEAEPKPPAEPVALKYKVHEEDAPRREPQETCS